MTQIIGIDLGTSNSAAAIMMDGSRPLIIPAAEGPTLSGKAFPSIVAFKDNNLLVGEIARRQMISNPEGTIIAAKRKMGTNYKFKVYEKEYTPEQISAFILQKIKRDAEAFLGQTIDTAVITVPANFNDNQRQATKDAGEIAGLRVHRIINEPTAAALAYGLEKGKEDLRIMVIDLGGGTLDVTVLETGGDVYQVNSTSGDTRLGGTDMDNTLVKYVVEKFREQSTIDIRNDKAAMMRIKEAVEEAKIRLSFTDWTEINLPFITYDPATGTKNLAMNLTRAELEGLVQPIIERCREPMMRALQDARLTPEDLHKIILIGGPTKMPLVRQFVKTVMGKEPEHAIDPMEAVALGASIQAATIDEEIKTTHVLEIMPFTFGIEVVGGLKEPLLDRNAGYPVAMRKVFTTSVDNQNAVVIHVVQGE
jgi:molecular chaperone DnaK